MGLTMKEKQAVVREYRPRYQKASKKEKPALLDEFIRLTGYHRLKKDRDALILTGKSLTKLFTSLKSRIPIRTFSSGEERKTPGFRQTGTAGF